MTDTCFLRLMFHKAACGGVLSLIIILLQIYWRICQSKNFYSRLRCDRVTSMGLVCLFWDICVVCVHRTCVNGRTVTSKTKVKHGDRILWGNNHFFRINCPKANSAFL